MALFGSSASNLIGLDIGSSTIKVVSLQSVRGGYQLESAGVEPLPGGSVVDGAIAKREAVADAINHVFHSRKIKGRIDCQFRLGPCGHRQENIVAGQKCGRGGRIDPLGSGAVHPF